jgi:hypothetical protein
MKQAALGARIRNFSGSRPEARLIATAQERAIEITQRHGAQPSRVRPNVLQRRRLAMRLSRTTNPGAAPGPDASPKSGGH